LPFANHVFDHLMAIHTNVVNATVSELQALSRTQKQTESNDATPCTNSVVALQNHCTYKTPSKKHHTNQFKNVSSMNQTPEKNVFESSTLSEHEIAGQVSSNASSPMIIFGALAFAGKKSRNDSVSFELHVATAGGGRKSVCDVTETQICLTKTIQNRGGRYILLFIRYMQSRITRPGDCG